MTHLSRREFVALAATATGAAVGPFAASRDAEAAAVTAQEVVDRIKQHVGVPWKAETVDTFKAGNPATVVTGIVTTAMATMGVLERAVKAGANLVISCEPTFYGRSDTPTPTPTAKPGATASAAVRDAVFAAKDEFITRHKLVIWRFNEHWRLRTPDPLAQGLRDALGWSRFGQADDPRRVTVPEITLGALASQIKTTLHARGGIRVLGDRQTKVRTLGLLPGSTPIQASLTLLPAVDAIVAGEVREWETVEYARDTITAGGRKGLVLIGRILSEEPGMHACAQWLNTIVPEVRATAIPVGDPYWSPR